MAQTLTQKDNLTFEKVWLMFQETREQAREENRALKQRMEEENKSLTQQMKETDRKLDKLAKMYGGVSKNSQDFAEEFFYNGLKNREEIHGIQYEEVSKNMQRATKKLEGEYDIILHDGDTIVVIEVKYKFHPDDVDDFYERQIPKFRKLFPEYNEKKLVCGIATLAMPDETRKRAFKYGFLVLSQSGENVSVLNEKGFDLKRF